MPSITRREIALLLIGIGKDGFPTDSVGGITRLQKFLYLLEFEGGVRPSGEDFEFEPYDAGPYSSRLYDDLEFLENLGLLASEVTAEATEEQEPEIDKLSFGELMGEDDRASDAYEERKFYLTEKGKAKIEHLLEGGEYQPVVDGIRKIKSKYGCHSLRDLLYYVYRQYPEMTTESKIKDKVLGHRRH